jgi:hypothetical protein
MPNPTATWIPFQPDGVPALKINFPNLGTGAVLPISIGPSRLFGLYAINTQATTAAYVQVFDAIVGNIVLGTTIPDEQLFLSAAAPSTAFIQLPRNGLYFANGISVQSTTTPSGNTGSASGVYVYAMYLNP